MPPTTASQSIAVPAQKKTAETGYLTFVEGVGPIPRDIYKQVKSDPLGDLPRYSIHIVVQHLLIFITFIILSLTGLPIYFSDLGWASFVISLFGGIDTARLIHKIAAFTMMFASAYHIVTIVGGTLRKIRDKEFDYRRTQIPRPKDLLDMIHDIKYFLGLEPYRPMMEKFMYKQKLHYLAIMWGSFVLIGAGSALLFPDIMTKIFPATLGRLLPQGAPGGGAYPAFLQELARLMHADEAIMSLIVLAFWHWTNVHLVPGGDRVILESPSGKIRVRVDLFEGAMPGILYLPLGLGHRAYDKFSKDKGENPNEIIYPGKDPLSGYLKWWDTPVRVEKI